MSDQKPEDKKPDATTAAVSTPTSTTTPAAEGRPNPPKPAVRAALKHTLMMQSLKPPVRLGDGEETDAEALKESLAPALEELPELLRTRSPHSTRPPNMPSTPPPATIPAGPPPGMEVPPESDPPTQTIDGIHVKLHGQTDVGLVREHNEDNFIVFDATSGVRGVDGKLSRHRIGERGSVFAVCDGMGGAAAGEVASQMAVDTIFEMMRAGGVPQERDDFARRLVHAVEEAGSRIFAAAKSNKSQRGMGTTATVAGLVDKVLFVGQVGDSRAYVLRGDHLAQITKDQSLITQLIEAGQLTEEEAESFEFSNIILQALGTAETVQVDLTFLELRRGDRLMICSDGLSGLVHPQVIRDVLLNIRDVRSACATLIEMARNGGGHDNITCIVADFDGAALPEVDELRPAYQQYPLVPISAAPVANATAAQPVDSSDAPSSRAPAKSKGSSTKLVVLMMFVIAAIVLAAAFFMGRKQPIEPSAPPPASSAVIPPAAAPMPARTFPVAVSTDIANAMLTIDGLDKVALDTAAAKQVTLAEGAYRFEARVNGNVLATANVTVAEGSGREVALNMPSGAAENTVGAAAVPAAPTPAP